MSKPLSFRWDEGFVTRLDAAAGDVPRSAFVRRAVEREIERMAHVERAVASAEAIMAEPERSSPSVLETAREVLADESYRAGGPPLRAAERALSEANGPSNIEQSGPGTVPSSEGVRSAAPAEQPERRVSPSKSLSPRVPFRRDVKPFPRGGS